MGIINVVGTGPGSTGNITPEALECIKNSEIIIGYATYLDLIEPYLEGKRVISSKMMQEVQRCTTAFEEAEAGASVAMISGGDPGIYAMAGLIYEIAVARDSNVEINVIPGLAAINSCAARLGAPLMHDFVAISLSDLLTPWDVIEKRLKAAASADFVIALYNPKSKRRASHIERAREIILEFRGADTPVGIVTAATRENESIIVTTLDSMLQEEINMQSCVLIGNSTTFTWRGKMITPRGYKDKYTLAAQG
ncbi:precorrin-3B C(17)-methyltransferase [Desulfosediminicola flagellatus]|uniref:precorrin-3B C(17)-methyltransferase n=1 Tax=Desulfosediminicola flagellatus TaxID=2569541 RepID=UPI0010AC684F|nr:precorrin-3B C(17)-methyltransferase [Desulfosediminicola flagellatus]